MAIAYPDVEWLFVLCDLDGNALSRITRVAQDKRLTFTLNRPASCSFTVPSDNAQINLVHADGYPYLSAGNRVLKAFRRESGSWVIRFAGRVMHLEDNGDDGQTMKTTVTCYDPMVVLNARLVVKDSSATLPAAGATYAPGSTAGNTLAKNQVSWTNSGLDDTGIRTVDGTFNTTTSQTVAWERGKTIGQALVELTETGTLDLAFDPVDRTDGKLVEMSVYSKRGSDKTAAVFAYGMGNHSVSRFRRVEDATTLANSIIYDAGAGGATAGTSQDDSTSKTAFRTWQAMGVLVQGGAAFSNTLATNELAIRKNPRVDVFITPHAERAPQPFTEYFLGDTVQVYCSSNLRKSIGGQQRVYQLSVDVDDNGFERVGELGVGSDI